MLVALIAFFAVAFTSKTKVFKVDTEQSKLSWVGKKVTGEHSGNIKIKEGKLRTDGKKLTGGDFVIDMTSITVTDITNPEYNQKLVGHLKNDDFFSTDKFPESTLTIMKATALENGEYKLKGILTIKGVKNEIEFPAKVEMGEKEIKATAKIIVDRTKFGIKYGSKSFIEGLGDKAIYDDFEMNVDLVAKQ